MVMVCVSFSFVNAQTEEEPSKNVEHYIGLQANQLIRQIFNFGGNTAVITNPYLINYAVVFGPAKAGINVGSGFTFDQVKTGDATNQLTTDINSTFFRVGFEKKAMLTKRWQLGFGADILMDQQKNESVSKVGFGFETNVETTTTSKENGLGLGPRLTLSYLINSRILVGTETTYYFRRIKSIRKVVTVTTQRDFNGNFTTNEQTTEDDDTLKKLQLNLPAVLWIVVRI